MTYTPKHTTAEYLAWIDGRIVFLDDEISRIEINSFTRWQAMNYRASLLANRDVLVRHQSTLDGVCMGCSDFTRFSKGLGAPHKVMFPCPTYLDIAQRLNEVMK